MTHFEENLMRPFDSACYQTLENMCRFVKSDDFQTTIHRAELDILSL